MFKKSISVILSLLIMLGAVLAVSVSAISNNGSTYYVAGDFLTPKWSKNANPMTQNNYEFEENMYDYYLTVRNVPAGEWEFKVTDGTWENSWGGEDGENYMFILKDTGNVTIYFNSLTKSIAVKAEYLDDYELKYISVVGGGKAGWLNGSDWNLNEQSNIMKKTDQGLYEITYTNVPASSCHQFKFACNGEWDYSWGASSDNVLTGNNINIIGVLAPIYNITFEVLEDNSTVTLRIDVSKFDFVSKQGEVPIEIIITPSGTEPSITDPSATDPTETEPPTTDPPATDPTETESSTTVPPATDSTKTEPFTTDPPATDPTETEPFTTVPPATDPSTSEPPSTNLFTTTSPETEESATQSPTTKPSVTDSTVPFVTDPTVPYGLLGDADGDGEVNVKDATYIQLYLAKLLGENYIDLTVCDIDKDEDINVRDVTYLQLKIANLL